MPQTRQLAAIMFTDIVGYTTLMGQDEAKAFAILDKNRAIQKLIIEQYKGRWIKELGDGVMSSFNSVSDAVNAAIKIQQTCNAAKEFQLRIGIHQGEVVFVQKDSFGENDDVFGDGVNIAARIQALATAGGIWVSEAVNHNLSNKIDIETEFVKTEQLKNVKEPVRIYQVKNEGVNTTTPEKPVELVAEKSIAVLPFVNMSNDPEQEFFSDGISEEIINMLAQVNELKVIGRTSSFAFKGKNLDLKLIGEQLKVNYLLEGSLRKAGNKLRITAQLIEVANGYHLYSEKFDRELADVFAIQDEIAEAILNAVKVRLLKKAELAIHKNYSKNVEAYQFYLKGRYHFNRYEWPLAIEAYRLAIGIDSEYAIAYAHLAICHHDLAFFNVDPERNISIAQEAADKALALDDESSDCQYAIGRLKMWHHWDFYSALEHLEKAVQINPNNADALTQLGRLYIKLKKAEQGITCLQKADELNPFSVVSLFYISAGYFDLGDYDMVHEYARRLISLDPNFPFGHAVMGVHYFYSNQLEKAVAAMELAVKMNGGLFALGHLANAYGTLGEIDKAKKVLETMHHITQGQKIGNAYFAVAHAGMGEWDQAFEYIELALQQHEGYCLELPRDFKWLYPEMLQDSRYLALVEKIGLP